MRGRLFTSSLAAAGALLALPAAAQPVAGARSTPAAPATAPAAPAPAGSAPAGPAPATAPAGSAAPATGPISADALSLEPKPEESKAVALGKQAYVALTQGGNVREIAGLLRDSINSLGGVCPNVTHYQVYRQTITVTTLKVACTNRPLYLLSVDADGGMLADGGDGQVEPMDSEDGTITAAPVADGTQKTYVDPRVGVQVAVPMPRGGGVVSSGPAGEGQPGNAPLGWMRWLFAVIAALVAFIAYTVYRSFTRPALVTASPALQVRRYSSEDKDRLVEESQQLSSNMWAHPSGLYIVRGRHGKRRIFPTWAFAQIYHVWGIKIKQIR